MYDSKRKMSYPRPARTVRRARDKALLPEILYLRTGQYYYRCCFQKYYIARGAIVKSFMKRFGAAHIIEMQKSAA